MSETPRTTHSSGQTASTIPANATILAIPDNVYCELDGESVILNIADGVYYGLNAVGHRIWEIVQQPVCLDEIVKMLVQEFEVGTEECERDVRELLTQLKGKGLVEIREQPVQ